MPLGRVSFFFFIITFWGEKDDGFFHEGEMTISNMREVLAHMANPDHRNALQNSGRHKHAQKMVVCYLSAKFLTHPSPKQGVLQQTVFGSFWHKVFSLIVLKLIAGGFLLRILFACFLLISPKICLEDGQDPSFTEHILQFDKYDCCNQQMGVANVLIDSPDEGWNHHGDGDDEEKTPIFNQGSTQQTL